MTRDLLTELEDVKTGLTPWPATWTWPQREEPADGSDENGEAK